MLAAPSERWHLVRWLLREEAPPRTRRTGWQLEHVAWRSYSSYRPHTLYLAVDCLTEATLVPAGCEFCIPAKIARRAAASFAPSYFTPLMKSVGVAWTPFAFPISVSWATPPTASRLSRQVWN